MSPPPGRPKARSAKGAPMSTDLPIYLDYNATTPVAPEVADAMLPFLREQFGNPSSSHSYGRLAAQAVAEARHQVATLIGARDDEIVFTGCATEANNLALLGVARALGDTRRHLVVSAVEHPAVMAPARQLEAQGWHLTVVPADACGRVSPLDVAQALRPDTALVSVMHANNEVGTLQPVAEIAALTRAHNILLHTDAAQSAGKIEANVDTLGVDLLTLAGHKFYAPRASARSTCAPARRSVPSCTAPTRSMACAPAPRTYRRSWASGPGSRASVCRRQAAVCAACVIACTSGSPRRSPASR